MQRGNFEVGQLVLIQERNTGRQNTGTIIRKEQYNNDDGTRAGDNYRIQDTNGNVFDAGVYAPYEIISLLGGGRKKRCNSRRRRRCSKRKSMRKKSTRRRK
jgi:hypothetical protein